MDNTTIRFKTHENSDEWTPVKQTEGSAGYDVFARIESPIDFTAGEVITIPTGVYVELPKNYACLVVPRSGLAFKYGITVVNSPGLIDSDYRGEIKVILSSVQMRLKTEFQSVAPNNRLIRIEPKSRIAQLVFVELPRIALSKTNKLSETTRGTSGLGSTGV